MRKLNILLTNAYRYWGGGGGEKWILSLAEGLKRRGHKVVLVCRWRSELFRRAKDRGIDVKPLKMKNDIAIFSLLQLIWILKKEKIDLVNSTVHRDSWLAGLAARICGIPHVHRRGVYYELEDKFKIRFTYKRLFDKLIVVSQSMAEELMTKGWVGRNRIVVIYNGVDLSRFDPNLDGSNLGSELGINPALPWVGIVGRLDKEKGHIFLLQAAKRIIEVIPQVRFLIVGDGPLRGEIKSLVEKLNINSQVIFTGFREDIPEILSLMDIFVLPSLTEGFPNALLEAMAMAKPVVATRVGGIPEAVQPGITGILVPPGDSLALVEAIIELLVNKDKARRMGEEGRRLVEEKFSLERMIAETERFYYEMVPGPRMRLEE